MQYRPPQMSFRKSSSSKLFAPDDYIVLEESSEKKHKKNTFVVLTKVAYKSLKVLIDFQVP
jgi:hypothetical protein